MNTKLAFSLFVLLASLDASAQALEEPSKTLEEKEAELLDYSNLRDVLRQDGLESQVVKKQKIVKRIREEKKKEIEKKYVYPEASDFWGFASEYWLVKNAPELSWDAPRPDYGIGPAFKALLEELGYFHHKFRILIIDSPEVAHLGLPDGERSGIYLLSLPFMRSLDLTKVEISLLLLEDFLRLKDSLLRKNLDLDTKNLGQSFSATDMDKSFMKKALSAYNEAIYKKGFSFQQQYELTKKMDVLLKSRPKLWNAYFKLLSRIDRLVKENELFSAHNRMYPSPELQLEWLKPKKRIP